MAGGLLLATAFFWIPSTYAVVILLIPLSLAAMGRGVSQPSMLSLVSKYAPNKIRGAVMGTFQSSASLGRVLGPVIAGILYDQRQALPFYLAGALLALVFLLALTLQKNQILEETLPQVSPANVGPSAP